MDLVIPVSGKRSESLRYTLRSMAACKPHTDLWLIGPEDPYEWLGGCAVVVMQQGPDRYRNTAEAMMTACLLDDISDPFIWSNDDIVALSATAHYDWDRGYVTDYLIDDRRLHATRKGAIDSLAILKKHGIRDPKCYELHIPIVVHKEPMVEAMQALMHHGGTMWWKRTIYGNLAGLDTETRADVKIEAPPLPPDWVSTSDATWDGAVGETIRRTYDTPCVYERDN